MKNMKSWKRLLAVGMCTAMVFSMPVGVSATENQDTEETVVTDESTTEDEAILRGDSGVGVNVDEKLPQTDKLFEETEGAETEAELATDEVENQEDKEQEDKEQESEPLISEANFTGFDDVEFTIDKKMEWQLGETGNLLVENDYGFFYIYPSGYTYIPETGKITISRHSLWSGMNENMSRKDNMKVSASCKVNVEGMSIWGLQKIGNINYVVDNWTSDNEMPEFINTSYEFNGTQDMVFNFKNGIGDNEIQSVKGVQFTIVERNTEQDSYLVNWWIATPTSYEYNIEKGQVTLYKHAVSAIVYDAKQWTAVSNVYGKVRMEVELANGKSAVLDSEELGGDSWTVKILEKSSDAAEQYREDVPKGKAFTVEEMQTLVDINKTADVILRTPEGVYYTFAKGTMHMIEGKTSYPLGVEIIKEFSKSDINNSNVTKEDFVERINFEYSGELPGTPKISIPVDSKWNGQILYYYGVMEDGTLKDTGKSGKVENGIFDVLQSHCSDYVLLAKAPKEIGVTENTDNDNNQSGTGNTQGTENNTNPQFKPADTTKTSPKTGDNNMILLFVVLCVGSCLVGVSTLKARRRTR